MLLEQLQEKYGAIMAPSDVAEVLHQHPTHVRAMCQEGKLPATQIGNRWRIPTTAFAAMFEDGEKR